MSQAVCTDKDTDKESTLRHKNLVDTSCVHKQCFALCALSTCCHKLCALLVCTQLVTHRRELLLVCTSCVHEESVCHRLCA